jgi:hypothetical protein
MAYITKRYVQNPMIWYALFIYDFGINVKSLKKNQIGLKINITFILKATRLIYKSNNIQDRFELDKLRSLIKDGEKMGKLIISTGIRDCCTVTEGRGGFAIRQENSRGGGGFLVSRRFLTNCLLQVFLS